VLGGYLALMTVIFFWLMNDTDFFSNKFGVKSLRKSPDEEMAAFILASEYSEPGADFCD